MNNMFLMTFAELADRKQNKSIEAAEMHLQMDVLIAILEKVTLKRDNYLTLMQNLKSFIADRQTQKKGYKLVSKVVERIELTNLDDIAEIKAVINPIMAG